MAKKKSKKTPAKNSTPGAAPTDLDVGEPPEDKSPKAQAQYFMDMLDAFAQQGTPEAKRIRSGLVGVVTDYEAAEDKEAARELVRVRLLGLEAGVADLLLRSTRKLRDRMVQESRKLGTSSPVGKKARAGADGLTAMVDGLEKLLQAAETADDALRDQGHALIEKARGLMQD